MFYPASFHRQLDLAAAVVVESVSESAAAAEQKDHPQAVTSTAKTASSVSSAAAAAAEQKDNPQAGIASESRRRFTSTSTVCCT